MSSASEFKDLLDLVDEAPGWRTTRSSDGWRIYPADKSKPVIHASPGTDPRGIDNLRALLRRAGLPSLIRPKRTTEMPQTNGKDQIAPAVNAAPAPVPRDLVAEARHHISQALESLSSLDSVLSQIAGEQQAIQQIKHLFQSLSK